jgi:ABC-type nitrate/sulfonate/bicarbonate transport system substrate-binding protein
MKLSFLALGCAAALLAVSAVASRAGDESVNYSFSKVPVNALGVTSMADLRGKPVLIDFWGTH